MNHHSGFNHWTKSDENVLKELYSGGESLDCISKKLNRTKNAIAARVVIIGCHRPSKINKCGVFTDAQLLILANSGISVEERIITFLQTYPRSGIDVARISSIARHPSLARKELQAREDLAKPQVSKIEKRETPIQDAISSKSTGEPIPDVGELLVKIYNELLVIEKIQLERLEFVKQMIKEGKK